MTTFYLIRHANCDTVGKVLTGRMPGVHLNEDGKKQAARLARGLSDLNLERVVSSPLERALETASALAAPRGLSVEASPALDELQTGVWTGCSFDELYGWELWQRFNFLRSCTRIPGGELMAEAQVRAVAELERLRTETLTGIVAVVSHADIIKALLAHYLGVHLDLFQRIEISPASLSVIELSDSGPRICSMNFTFNNDE